MLVIERTCHHDLCAAQTHTYRVNNRYAATVEPAAQRALVCVCVCVCVCVWRWRLAYVVKYRVGLKVETLADGLDALRSKGTLCVDIRNLHAHTRTHTHTHKQINAVRHRSYTRGICIYSRADACVPATGAEWQQRHTNVRRVSIRTLPAPPPWSWSN